jgi:mannose-1-phosphate guanylyltransferase
VIWQPANRDTAAEILLSLAHVSHREPFATVAVFPSDHCVVDEERFMTSVQQAVAETRNFPRELTLLGITPDMMEGGQDWVEPAGVELGRETCAVRRFWEEPSQINALELLRRGALWNSFVFVAQAATLWEMTRQAEPTLYEDFMHIRRALSSSHAVWAIENVYLTMQGINFSSDICASLPSRLRVLRVPEVGWSDWGSVERILTSLQRLGKVDECLARLRRCETMRSLRAPTADQRQDARLEAVPSS